MLAITHSIICGKTCLLIDILGEGEKKKDKSHKHSEGNTLPVSMRNMGPLTNVQPSDLLTILNRRGLSLTYSP